MISERHPPACLRASSLALGLALALLGLLGSTGGCDAGGEEVCSEYANLLATAWVPCGVPYDVGLPLVRDALQCDEVIGVVDEAALRQGCFPRLPTLSCDDLRTDRYPAACLRQLIYPESLPGWVN